MTLVRGGVVAAVLLLALSAVPFGPGAEVDHGALAPPPASTTSGQRVALGRPVSPAATLNGYGEVVVNSSDPALVPNTGLMANLTGFTTPNFPEFSKFQLGVEEALGAYLAVFGLFQNSVSGPYAFFSVFNNTTAAPVFQTNESSVPISVGGAYDFALTRANGTNWSLALNGLPFDGSAANSTFDFGVSFGDDLTELGLSEVAFGTQTVEPVTFPIATAFATLTPDGWHLPTEARTYYRGDPTVRWGVAGASQNGSLYPGMLAGGTGILSPANGTAVWNGSASPVALALAVDPSVVPGTGTALVTGSASAAGGSALGGFPLFLADSAGGSFTDAAPASSGNGTIRVGYNAPNLTANATDTLHLYSRALGATGAASTSVRVTPAIRVLLALSGSTTLRPGRTTLLTLQGLLPGGGAAVGFEVTLSANDGATVLPGLEITGTSGTAVFQFLAPNVTGTVRLLATVEAEGYWGIASFSVTVSDGAPSWAARLAPLLLPAVGAVLVVALIAVLLARRPPKQAMRPLGLRRARSAPTPAPVEPGPPGAPVSRTPPSGGSP